MLNIDGQQEDHRRREAEEDRIEMQQITEGNTLAENAGMKPIEVVTELRAQHAAGVNGAGIDVKKGKVSDMYAMNVVQPLLVSTSAIKLATETVSLIMKIDDLIVVQ